MSEKDLQLQLKIQAEVDQALNGLLKLDTELKKLSKTSDKVSKQTAKNPMFDELKSQVDDFGSSVANKFGPLGNIITKGLTTPLGGVGAAFAALGLELKFFFDQALEGEKILKIERQFDKLSKSAGLAGETLKNEFVGSLDGLVDDTDAIQALNKSIVNLGDNAKNAPALMDTARRATNLFGGDVIQNYEAINQAIATGQTRSLRQIGIIVDSEKAYKDYAASIGVLSSELNEAGRQQALILAIQEQSNKKFKDLGAESSSLANSFKRLGVTLNNIIESFQKFISNNYSEFFIDMFDAIDRGLKKVSGNFGASDRIKELNEQIVETQNTINKLTFAKFERDTAKGFIDSAKALFDFNGASAVVNNNLNLSKKKLAELNAELAKYTAQQKEATKATNEESSAQNNVDQGLVARRNALRLAEQQALDAQLLNLDLANKTAVEQQEFEHQNRMTDIFNTSSPQATIEERYLKEKDLLAKKHEEQLAEFQLSIDQEMAKNAAIEDIVARREANVRTENKKTLEETKLLNKQELEDTALNNKRIEESYKEKYTKAKSYVDPFVNGLTSSFIEIAEGTESVGRSLEKFAGNFIRQMAEMTLRAVMFDAIMKSLGFGVSAASGGGNASRVAQVPTNTFAEGGLVTGPGTGTSDSIPARLSNGEFVMTAAAVKRYGSNFFNNLNAMSRGGMSIGQRPFGHFADGGLVESSSQAPQVVIENKGSEKQVSRTEFDPISAVTTVFLEDAQKNGPISKSMQSTYGIKRGGFR